MFEFFKKHFLSQKKLSSNIANIIGSLTFIILFYYTFRVIGKLNLCIILLVCALYLLKPLLSLLCIIKFWNINKKIP